MFDFMYRKEKVKFCLSHCQCQLLVTIRHKDKTMAWMSLGS